MIDECAGSGFAIGASDPDDSQVTAGKSVVNGREKGRDEMIEVFESANHEFILARFGSGARPGKALVAHMFI